MPRKSSTVSKGAHQSPSDTEISGTFSYDNILSICASLSGCSVSDLMEGVQRFQSEVHHYQEATKDHLRLIRNNYLITAFQVWAKFFHHSQIDQLLLLVNSKYLPFKDTKGKPLKIDEFDLEEHYAVIDRIRADKDVTLKEREALVKTYLIFVSWLWMETFKPGMPFEDSDRAKSKNRVLDFDKFIDLLEKLDKRGRIVAKLLYFGGSRTLDEIVNLDLSVIDFDHRMIQYDGQFITYPKHVFDDIRESADGRKKGPVFLGRNKTTLNRITFFRNLKEAASQVGLGTSFTHKELIADK